MSKSRSTKHAEMPGPKPVGAGMLGFEDAQAAFVAAAPVHERFNESLALLRAFNLIGDAQGRQQVIAFARRLSNTDG